MSLAVIAYTLIAMWAGASIHRYYTKPVPQPQVRETYAPQERQQDGSVIAARIPTPEKVITPPPHQLPKGTKEERRITVTVKPAPPKRDHQPFKPEPDGQCRVPDTYVCPPVTVDLSLVRSETGRRVIASSPDGTISTAIDIPIEEPVARNYRNSLDASYASKTRYSFSMMRETTIMDVPVAGGAGVMCFDGQCVPALSGRIRF